MHDIDDDMMRSDPEIMALSLVANDTGASTHLQIIVHWRLQTFIKLLDFRVLA